jgi:hypothetical protein
MGEKEKKNIGVPNNGRKGEKNIARRFQAIFR